MENRKAKLIQQIERLLNDSELLEVQRKTLVAFDRFNELEAQCRLSTRHGYIQTLHEFGTHVQKPYEEMTREDLQVYIAEQRRHHRQSVVKLQLTHLKRFYRWVEWRRVNEGKKMQTAIFKGYSYCNSIELYLLKL